MDTQSARLELLDQVAVRERVATDEDFTSDQHPGQMAFLTDSGECPTGAFEDRGKPEQCAVGRLEQRFRQRKLGLAGGVDTFHDEPLIVAVDAVRGAWTVFDRPAVVECFKQDVVGREPGEDKGAEPGRHPVEVVVTAAWRPDPNPLAETEPVECQAMQ